MSEYNWELPKIKYILFKNYLSIKLHYLFILY